MPAPVFVAFNDFLCGACRQARGSGERLLHREAAECFEHGLRATPKARVDYEAWAIEHETYMCFQCGREQRGLIRFRDNGGMPACGACGPKLVAESKGVEVDPFPT